MSGTKQVAQSVIYEMTRKGFCGDLKIEKETP
jgi:hypothetical protein